MMPALSIHVLAHLLLVATAGIAFVVFFIAGLHREGIEVGGHPYVGMQLLTPFSIIALILMSTRQQGTTRLSSAAPNRLGREATGQHLED